MSRVPKHAVFLLIFVTLTFSCVTSPLCPTTLLTYNDLGVATFLSDDRTVAVFLSYSSSTDLYKVKVDGTQLMKLSENLPFGYDQSISHDGSLISFSQVSDGQGDICIVKIDGTAKACLTSGPEHDFQPVFSPDGSKIYFIRARVFKNYSPMASPTWHGMDIYSINTDGKDLKKLTFEDAYRLNSLSIDHNGDLLMVMKAHNSDPFLLIPIIDPFDKKTFRPDLHKFREKFFLFWKEKIDYNAIRNVRLAPDGNHVLFSWPLYDNLFLMDLRTNITKKIWSWEPENAMCHYYRGFNPDFTLTSEARQMGRMNPRFSPDGQQVVFSTLGAPDLSGWESRLWVVNVDGTGLRSIEMK